jgi:hypothetical protein
MAPNQKIISALLPWTCTQQKKHQLALKSQNARGRGSQAHFLKKYEHRFNILH